MEKLKNTNPMQLSKGVAFKCLALLTVIFMLNTGCKKGSVNADKDYGNGRLTVQCSGLCNVSYTVADVEKNVTVDKAVGTYSIKYQRNYALKINVTPADVDQSIVVNVYSRENKQIYHNEANKKLNEVWSAQVLIP